MTNWASTVKLGIYVTHIKKIRARILMLNKNIVRLKGEIAHRQELIDKLEAESKELQEEADKGRECNAAV